MSTWMRNNVVGLVALFVALGGTAIAASAPKNSVTSKSIKNGAVAGKDVKDNSLTGTDVNESTLSGVPLADGSVGSAKIADGAVRAGDLGTITERVGAQIDDQDPTANDDEWIVSTLGTASCNAGEVAIGGGARLASSIGVGSDSAISRSTRSSSGTAWEVTITSDEGGSNDYVPVVYCLSG